MRFCPTLKVPGTFCRKEEAERFPKARERTAGEDLTSVYSPASGGAELS